MHVRPAGQCLLKQGIPFACVDARKQSKERAMAWSQICEATDEDRKRLELAAVRFIKIHHLESHARYL